MKWVGIRLTMKKISPKFYRWCAKLIPEIASNSCSVSRSLTRRYVVMLQLTVLARLPRRLPCLVVLSRKRLSKSQESTRHYDNGYTMTALSHFLLVRSTDHRQTVATMTKSKYTGESSKRNLEAQRYSWLERALWAVSMWRLLHLWEPLVAPMDPSQWQIMTI